MYFSSEFIINYRIFLVAYMNKITLKHSNNRISSALSLSEFVKTLISSHKIYPCHFPGFETTWRGAVRGLLHGGDGLCAAGEAAAL